MYDLYIDKIEDLGLRENSIRFWSVRCNICKNVYEARASNVKNRNRTVCTDCSPKLTHKENYGNRKHPLYSTWALMLRRVDNTNVKKQGKDHYYKGITICEEWKDFNTFVKWSENNGYKKELSIDRIDNKGPYSPANCRWTDQSTQNSNQNIRKDSTTGLTGINNTDRINYPYSARLNWKGKILLQKRFKTIKEAITARNEAIVKYSTPHNLQEI